MSRDIKLCAHKVGPWFNRESRAVIDCAPRSLSGALTGRTVEKNSGQLELTDWRWTGIKAVIPCSSGLRTCAFEHAFPADQHGTTKKSHVRSVLSIPRTVGSELAVLLAVKALGSWRLLAANLLMPSGLASGGSIPNWAPATGPPAVRQRRGSAEGCRPSASRGGNPPTWRGGAR
jgi:hypothetical protein